MVARQFLFIRSTQPENVFGRYTLEILAAEGLMGFEIVDLDSEEMPPTMEFGDLIVLSRCFLRSAEIDRLQEAVLKGARLLCIQPSKRLAERFGWNVLPRVEYPGWMRIRQGYPGAGIPIQTHVPIPAVEPGETCTAWEYIAETTDAAWSDSHSPAVVCQQVGQGKTAFFFYDLPQAVAWIRFGNPDLASYHTCGCWNWSHAGDMFSGHVDERVAHLPQGDFHGQLLAKVATDICPYPLARLWYYAKSEQRAAAVFQSDDDGSKPSQFQELSQALEQHGGTATFYLMEDTKLSDKEVFSLCDHGHTFGPHVNGTMNTQEELYFTFPQALADETTKFRKRYGFCSRTIQSHCAPWYGYMSWVPLHIQYGYRLLFAYISLPQKLLNRYMCGSGRPLKFYNLDGTLYDCWQQPLVTYDDVSLREQITHEPEAVVAEFERLLRDTVERTHTAVPMLSHPVSFSTYSRPFIEACLDLLQKERVPIYNADAWCAFQDRRRAVRTRQTQDDANGHSIIISNLGGRLPVMFPLREKEVKVPALTVNGIPVEGRRYCRLGEEYCFVQLENESAQKDVQIRMVF